MSEWRPTLQFRWARKKLRGWREDESAIVPYPDSMRVLVFQQYWEHLTFNSPGSYVHDGTGEWRDIPVVDDKEKDA